MQSKNAKRPRKKGFRVISGILCSILLVCAIAGAALVAPVPVFALSAGGIKSTIASLIISLLMQSGVAPTNQTWLNQLNSSYGYTIETAINEGLLTETADGLIDSGLASSIESSAEYTSLGLNEIFTTTAADTGVIANAGSVNIANTAINVGKAGTIGAFAGAAAIGVGTGVLINHIREKIGNFIKYGVPINRNDIISDMFYDGAFYYGSTNYGFNTFSFNQGDVIGVKFKNGNNTSLDLYALNDGRFEWFSKYYNTSNQLTSSHNNNVQGYQGKEVTSFYGRTIYEDNYFGNFESKEDAENYINSIINGSVEMPHHISPDIVGPEGNQYYDSNNDTFPGLVNQIPEGKDMKPVDMNDYQNFANQANDNTQNGDTGQETQGDAFDQFIDPYIVDAPTVPDEPIIPDNPDNTVPDQPDKPLIPDQPTFPDKPEATPEDIQDMGDLTTTPDLRSVFPFCIPWDIYHIFLIFDTGENRKAPHIDFIFPGTDWHIDVDLAQFDPVAALLRLLELILFIVGLAVATRKLIGATG